MSFFYICLLLLKTKNLFDKVFFMMFLSRILVKTYGSLKSNLFKLHATILGKNVFVKIIWLRKDGY